MKHIRVTLYVDVPEDATYHEIDEWLRFECGMDSMLSSNTLGNRDLIALSLTWNESP